MSKIRINDLARELEVKSKSIVDYLPEIGITDKRSHSSALDEEQAARVRDHFSASSEPSGAPAAVKAAPASPKAAPVLTKQPPAAPGIVHAPASPELDKA